MTLEAASVFVYYRVRAVDAAAAIAAVHELHARLPTTMPGLSASLSRRVEAGSDSVTLMEAYTHAGGVTQAAQREVEARMQAALAGWLIGPRHVEVFVPCA